MRFWHATVSHHPSGSCRERKAKYAVFADDDLGAARAASTLYIEEHGGDDSTLTIDVEEQELNA